MEIEIMLVEVGEVKGVFVGRKGVRQEFRDWL